MVDISPEQYRMLKKISRNDSAQTDSMSKDEKEICAFLATKGFLSVSKKCRTDESGNLDLFNTYPSEYTITQSGKAQIYAFKSTFYKWWIPVIISIAAIAISLAALLFEMSTRQPTDKTESSDILIESTVDSPDVLSNN